MEEISTVIARVSVALVCVSILAGCGLAPQPPSIGYARAGEPAAARVEELSRVAQDSANFSVFAENIAGPFGRTFDAAIRVLKEQGDPLGQADSDKGYIATAAQKLHGPPLGEYWTQYFIVFQPLSPVQTRMVFKLCSYWWDDVHYPTSMYVHAADGADANYAKAARFVQAVRILSQ